MTIVVVGSTGQLARHLQELLPDALFLTRHEADLTQPAAVEARVRSARPSTIINAAAYTAVDKAESDRDAAWRVNAESPAALARVAAELDVPLVHVSTDYVFDGTNPNWYLESDPVAPINVYGTTKLGGELAVAVIARKHWILRTSWVFSEYGNNFVKTMLRLGKEREALNVVSDQRGRPTYAGDLARLIASLIGSGSDVPYGIHHVGGGPAATWHEFATRIIHSGAQRGLIPRVIPVNGIPTSAYPTPAKRPLNSILQPSSHLQGLAPVDWEAGLEQVLSKLR